MKAFLKVELRQLLNLIFNLKHLENMYSVLGTGSFVSPDLAKKLSGLVP